MDNSPSSYSCEELQEAFETLYEESIKMADLGAQELYQECELGEIGTRAKGDIFGKQSGLTRR